MNVHVDLTTDPLSWPAWAGSPTDDDGWDLEWRVLVERMRREPTSAWAQRFRLGELAEPPTEFKRRFLTLVAYVALPITPGERLVPNGYLVQRMDEELSGERNRQIRESLAGIESSPRPVDRPAGGTVRLPQPRTGTQLTRAEILAERRHWREEGHKSEAIHKRLGCSKSTLIRARHKLGLIPWPED